MSWILFEILINLFEAWLILYFIKSRIHIVRNSFLLDSICIMCCATYYSLYLFIEMPANDVLVYVFPFFYALYMSRDRWYVSLFWVVILALFFTSTPGLVMHLFFSIFGMSSFTLSKPSYLLFWAILLNNLVLFVMVFSAAHLKRDHCYLSWKALISFLLTSILVFVVEECLYYLQQQINGHSLIFNIGYCALLFTSLLSILLFHFLTESSLRESQYRTEINLLSATKHHQQEFGQMYHDFITRQHDFKHQLEAIEELISHKDNSEARLLLADYKKKLGQSRVFITGNTTVDALLTAKSLTMKKNNISFRFNPYPLGVLPIPVLDFCSIVGNLLDNAIEGSMRLDGCLSIQPIIHLSFSRTYDVFRIVCENYCNPNTIHKEKSIWVSNKSNIEGSGIHGLGIPSIQRIVSQYEGYSSFSHNGTIFRADLSIPYSVHESEF